MARFKLDVGAATDVGRQRESNEDRYKAYVPRPAEDSELGGVMLVADGIGGARGGAEASQLAVERLLEELHSGNHHAERNGEDLVGVLREAIRKTSDEILDLGRSDPSVSGLGSTVVMALFAGETAHIAHVGDSRCYRIRGGTIHQLTADHTWVEDQVESGVLSPEEARQHPQRNVLTRTLGDTETPSVDVRSEPLVDGDLFLLCSDGLTNALSDVEILQTSRRFVRPQDLAEALVALANESDGSDNITIVACRCYDRESQESRGEPDDTEPILAPRLRRGRLTPRGWLLAVLVFVALVLAYSGSRLYAVRAFERGVEYAGAGQYLHARQEFSRAMRIGLDKERSEQLIDILLEIDEEPEAPELSSEND